MADKAIIWAPDVPLPDAEELPLPGRITHIMLHTADDDYAFLHESAIVHHGGEFYAAWNNSPREESERGTVVRWIRAEPDFSHRTPPAVLAPALDDETTIRESVQLLSTGGDLWAFVGKVHSQPRSPEIAGGAMVVFRFDEVGARWEPLAELEGFHPLNRPQRAAGGYWIMGGQFNLNQPRVALSDGDDLTRWQVVEIPSSAEQQLNFAETSLVVDGENVTAHVRSRIEAVFVSQSRDGGRSWPHLAKANLPMSSSKTCAGRFSTGQRYLALNLHTTEMGRRDLLAVAVSAPDDPLLRKLVLLRRGPSPAAPGGSRYQSSQWSYPSVEEYDGNVHVTYSVTKRDCWLSVLPLGEFEV